MQGKKPVFLFVYVFLAMGMMLNGIVLAESGSSDSTTDSNAGATATDDSDSSDDSNAETAADNSNSEDEKTTSSDGEAEIRLEDGKEKIREKIGEGGGGGVEREVKGRFIDENGNLIKFERKIKIKDGEIEIKTKLKIDGRGSNLSVSDSEGKKYRVRVTPEKLKTLMKERLNAENVTDFSIEEVKHKNIPRVVYKVDSEHPGRFLGIFKIALRAETQVDPETGEFLDINGPWWAFLVAEQLPDESEVVGNDSLAEEVVADDDELEGEFEDVEVEGEDLEIKAETRDGSSEIDIELEFNTAVLDVDGIVSEILDKLALSSEEISLLLEAEESDEALEDKEELEVEIESEDGSSEVGFELQFFLDSDSENEIVSAVSERLSTLTAEQIKNALDSEEENEIEDENTTA